MALRLQPEENIPKVPSKLANWSPAIGVIGFIFGNISLLWFGFGRPEFGDLALRVQHGIDALASDRVSYVWRPVSQLERIPNQSWKPHIINQDPSYLKINGWLTHDVLLVNLMLLERASCLEIIDWLEYLKS